MPYTYYTLLRAGYGNSTAFGGPTGPGALLLPGAPDPWESQSVRFLLHDSTDWERQGLGVRKMQSVLAPQLRESQLYYMIDDSAWGGFHLLARALSATRPLPRPPQSPRPRPSSSRSLRPPPSAWSS